MKNQIGKMFGHPSDPRTFAVDDRWPLPDCCIGLELEFENAAQQEDVYRIIMPKFVAFGHDPSLRGDGIELRFTHPLSGVDLTAAITELMMIVAEFARKNESPLALNLRTSLHVHLDVRNLTPEQFRRLKMVSIMFEKVLFHYCSPTREYNNFCLPTYRAEELRQQYANILDANRGDEVLPVFIQGASKYMAINFLTLKEFGSVEFRMHQGTLDMDEVIEWVSIIQCLKKAALDMQFDGPTELVIQVSKLGARPLGMQIFGPLWHELDYPDAEVDIMHGARFVQDLLLLPKLQYDTFSKADLAVVEEAMRKHT
jgi:hypothetical protein